MNDKVYCEDCKHLMIFDNEGALYVEHARCKKNIRLAEISWLSENYVFIMEQNPSYYNKDNDCGKYEKK
jgi:hypothetical protein